jgi:tyrocidine synthetase-3
MPGLVEHPDRIELPCDRARPALRQPSWQRVTGRVKARESDALAAFAVFVGKIASTRDFVIGTADGAVAVHLEPGERLAQLADRLASAQRVTALTPSEDPARHPLYDVGYGAGDPLGDLHVRITGSDYALYYDAQLFSGERAHRLAKSLEQVLRAPGDVAVGGMCLLGEAEAAEQLAELSSPAFNWPQHFVLHELFEARVDREPDAIAIVDGAQRVAYRELEARANALAHRLIEVGVGPDSIVALICDRSIEMIVAIVGVLKAGGAYLPIEPDAPAERVKYLLADSRAAAVVTVSAYATAIAHPHVIAVDTIARAAKRPEPRADPHHVAYVIYTSGSTGQPKGVLVEHRNVVHFILAEKEDFAIRASDALLQTSSYTFDASIDQIWLALTSGAKLVLVPKQALLDPAELSRIIDAEKVTHLDSVPALLGELSPMLASVRQVVVGGETCPVAVARAWSRTTRFWNEYGPTETTVGSLRYLVDPTLDLGTRVPIGRPIGLTRAYVLDWGGQPVPIGVRGELYLGGAGVARGYLGRDELTKERFVEDPFAHGDFTRMYKTGDVVAWLPDGSLEFFGRVDSQVKLRGFRIELGEIEAALEKHPDVSGAAASVLPGDRLCAHLTAKRQLDPAELRAHLAQTLPSYMIPDFFVQLEAFPRTVSGKIDRKSLPAPQVDEAQVEQPANQVEAELRAIWAVVLRLAETQIGVTRSFFELGGHSLLVMQMLARIRERLGVALAAQTVLAQPTIRQIATAIANRSGQGGLVRAPAGSIRPATGVQRRMFVIHQGAPQNTSYNLPLLYSIEGAIDEAALARACAQLIERHESLRTAFFFHEGEIVQKIASPPKFQLERYEGDVATASAQFVRPFQLDAPPLFRAAVFVNKGRVTHLAFDMHHIVSDGISIDVLLEDLLELVQGRGLAATTARFFDYAAWLDTDEAKQRLAAGRSYWAKLVHDEPPVLDLPYDFRRPLTRNQAAGEISLELPPEIVDGIARYAREREATPFAFFAALYSAFLSCMTGSADVLWGFPTAGRPHPELENVVGMFVNTLVFRTRVDGYVTFDELLRGAMGQIRESLRHEDNPFEEMVGDARAPAPGRNALFDTMLSYEGKMADEYRCGDAVLREQPLSHRFARTDMVFVIRERSSGGYWLRLEYSADLFKRATAARLARDFTAMIRRVLAEPAVKLVDLHAIDVVERERLIHGFNATAHALPDVAAVHELFDRHVVERPDAPAVVMRDEQLTYREVDARSNALANWLRRKGVARDQIVGILLDPCVEMLVSVLGVMKAGGAFMPIDPDYPLARKQHMLSDSGTRVLLTRGTLAGDLGGVEAVDLGDSALLAREPRTKPAVEVRPEDLAYVIYTSGSTGTPKGTLIEHRGLLNFAAWETDYFRLAPGDGVSKFAGFGFDASIAEIVPAFISGARLVVVPADLRHSIDELDAYFAQHGVALAFLPTQFGEQFLRDAHRHQLRAAFLAGEKLRVKATDRCEIVNGYGPTEYTVGATAFRVDRSYDNIPIGKPIWNTQVLILDRLGRPCPVGVPGELCLSGASIARGYLNRPDLTADKFVPNPFDKNFRMYRTGDLARWLDDGNVEFLGRIDTQVKVRGFRIELGEIEQALLKLPGIEAAVVVATENPIVQGDLSLVAYVEASGATQAATEGDLKQALGRTLPAYMVPARIVRIDAIPLTANGKVDKRRLPQVDVEDTPVVPPRDDRERDVRDIYAEILSRPVEAISVEASFLSLGGHSLKAAALLSAIFKRTGVQLKFAEFLERSTVADVAAALSTRSSAPVIEQRAPEDRALPLTAAQQRMFAVHQLSTWSTGYNLPFAWELAASVDLERLERALGELVARHHALRAEIAVEDGVPVQHFRDGVKLDVERLAIEDANLGVTLESFVRPFDLAHAPLLRAAIVRTEKRAVLAFDVHHVIADNLSVRLLLEDLEALYAGQAAPPPSPTFADHVWWEASDAGRAQRDAERAWWQTQFAELPSPLELPCDFDRPPRLSFEGDEVGFALSVETTARLLELAKTRAMSPLAVYFAAYAVVLSRLGNTPDLVIGVPTAGRHRPGMDRVVGMFVNTVPLRVKLAANEPFADLAARLDRESNEAFEHQNYQLNHLVADLGLARDPARNPLCDVMFAWEEAELAEMPDSPLGLHEIPQASVDSRFDLELTIANSRKAPQLTMVFSKKLFRRATAERFLGHLRGVLEQAVREPQAKISQLVMLQAWEREILVEHFNKTEAAVPDVTLVDLFAEHVRERPGAIAVEDGAGAYTFAEVDHRAAMLAGQLAVRGVGAEDIVALQLGRTRELLVAILGVMRAGAGYLPIDPDAPAERVSALLADSRARCTIRDPDLRALAGPPLVESRALSNGIAYVMYTSGSTGTPKGVVVEHRNVVNFVWSSKQALRVDGDDRILLFSSFTVDASVAQIGLAIAAGARLVIAAKDQLLDHDAFEAFVAAKGITHVDAVPLFWSGLSPKRPLALRRIVVGGDICPVAVAARWGRAQPLFNEYGPTEATITALRHEVAEDDFARQRLPVGRPIANTRVYVLDWTGNLAPLGVPGELYIGGAGVARGYLANDALTAQKFVASPFVPGDRLYRTGDRARWTREGMVDFLGRADNQVKIRGFRVELGEIEAALLRHAAVAEAAVIVDGKQRLVAYVVTRASVAPRELRSMMARTLPSYMVPEAVVPLAAFPVTPSGKIDRLHLPEPEIEPAGEDDAPASLAEEKLVEIWAEILKLAPYQIPVTRNFFELGGHSLLIVMLVARIQQTFAVRLAVTDVFARPTVRGLAELIEEQDRNAIVPIPKVERAHYPLSSVQRRMFAIHQANPLGVAYNMPTVFTVEGHVSAERFEEVVRALIARHASLRTSFHVVEGQPVAKIHASAPFSLQTLDSDEPVGELMQRLVQPFDLGVAPLWRVWLVRRASGQELIALDMHHIISDGYSMSILWREVVAFFRGAALPPLRITAGDFAVWQQSPARQTELAVQRAFWLEQFATVPPPLQLPYDFRHPAARSYAGDVVIANMSPEELELLNELSRRSESTLFATLLACWFVFLSRVGGSDDVVVGIPVSGRVHPDVQGLVGMFVNTIPWRAQVPHAGTFLDFLAATRETSLRVLASEEYQLEDLLNELGVQATPGRNPLFDVMFAFQGRAEDEVIDTGRVKLRLEEFSHRTAKMDVTLIVGETDAGLELSFEYATELFERATVERLANHFLTLVRDVLRNPGKPLAELELLTPREREHLLVELNDTAHDLPPVAGAHELFEGWVRRTPDAPCVVYGDTSWSYAEVDRRANAIAAWLGEHGIGREDVVPILMDQCAEMLPAVIGVLKAGAAFLPIDAAFPVGRKATILDDSRARALLTRGELSAGLAFAGPQLDIASAGERASFPRVEVARDNAAYVIYTSGSTGKPKGVVIEHGSLVNFAAWFCDYYQLQPGEGVSKYAGPSFDASISELFPACTSGATLVVVPAELRLQMKELAAYLEAKRVHIAFLPTQFGEQFLRTMEVKGLRAVGLGGEKLRFYRPTPWKVVNAYGPTEYTVYTTAFTVDRFYDNIPIGKPVWNTRVFVLDRHDRPCPIGVTGELCVSGMGIARGYLNRPELTAERFVDHPLEPGTRMYRIGDLARWLPDGTLECLGRIDTQVKVRGYRIELGEIEQTLLATPGISGATVVDVVDDAGTTELAAYYVGDVSADAIRAALRDQLSDYMIPAFLCRLDALPLTPSGKIDKRALPPVERAAVEVVPPADDNERAVVACFASVLGIEKISATASFFELGGHSLKAIALVGEIYQRCHVELKVSDVFRHPTPRALAKRLSRGSSTLGPIEPAPRADSFAASSVQTRMFLLQQMEPQSTAYNVPNLFAVAQGVTREQVAAALQQLVARYDAFRCAFFLDGAQVRMRVADSVVLPLATSRAPVSELVRPFDLGTVPVARAAWLETEGGPYLFFDMHHIATDGASLAMFIDELDAVLAGKALAPGPVGLVACTAWEHGEQATAVIAKQREYWRAQFPDGVPALGLVTDLPRPPVVDPAGDEVVRELPAATAAALRELARAHGLSMHALMLAAFDVLLARLTRQDEIAVGTVVSGRWHPDMHRVFGMFVNTLVLASKVDPKQPFLELAADVARRSIEALDNQAFPFADLVELVGDERHAGHTPLVDVMFSMQTADERFEGTGVLTPRAVEGKTAKFDLSLTVDETRDAIAISLEYRTTLFRRATAERTLRCFEQLVADIARRPDAPVEQLSILADEDRRLVVDEWNRTEVAFPDEVAAHRMFERAAARRPDARALVDGSRVYTYGEADAAANRLAHRLRALGVARDGVVAILTPPSAELILGELAALKAGGAFLPLDHRYPRERLEYMLRDSAARVLISAPGLDRDLDWAGARLVLEPALFADGPATPPQVTPRREDLAYVIYTSGSTGRPKGVMIEHASLVPFVQRMIAAYDLTERDRHSKYAGIGFDASIGETFPPLCCGGELHIVPDELRLAPRELAAWLVRSGITVMDMPTPIAEQFMQEQHPTGLRVMTTGGDKLRRYWPTTYLLANEYGPTESTVTATMFPVDRPYDNIPIGKPIANTKAFIVDPTGQPCPPGVPGELCLAGRGLARGYLGAPELTAKKFVHSELAGGRMYKTGDLARWLDDGNIEFLGRIDSQVKIRGFRIELGEIEQAILEVPQIRACVVIDRRDAAGDAYLAAYLVGDATIDAIRAQLATRLPDYMVPVAFVRLDALPFTTSGKIDRRRLPEPQLERSERVIVPPANPAETLVVEAFARVLGRSELGVTDDFFELGGNSLKAVAVVAALAGDFRITANDLFRLRTARAIAGELQLVRGDLQHRLIELVKELRAGDGNGEQELAAGLARYRERYKPYAGLSVHRQMSYRDVLLTGATGFLGSYLLRELLERSDAKVYVPIRARRRLEGWERLRAKTTRYFGPELLERHQRRIHLVLGDLSEPAFGLDRGTFDTLVRTVDCVVHAAALTKHYGETAAFVKANVDATANVIELARRAGCDFNMISTMSVGAGDIPGVERALFTEFDCDIGQVATNHYLRTKLEAEKLVHALRDDGLACNIFRVGFLAGDSQTLKFQDNAGDSGFVQTLKSYLALRRIPLGALAQSFCPVDEVATAIVRLLATSSLLDQTHHIDRELTTAEVERILAASGGRCEPMTDAEFYEWLAPRVSDPQIGPAATAMLLHQGLLEDSAGTEIVTLREKTDRLLARVGFAWSEVRPEQVWQLAN